MRFGQLLRDLRAQRGITLRQLAGDSDIDVSYLSRVERESIPPPQKEELLEAIIAAISASEEEARQLRDYAALDNENFPKDIAGKMKEMVGIPLLLRSVANKRLSAEDIEKITRYINDNY
ncbi:MAG: helix-turn-helix transcriptional regulator [Bacteroidota bacterium]|jgi:transcriptional regulator with XRE-family HTH domain